MLDESKTMESLKNLMTAEESITRFIKFLEKENNTELPLEDVKWLYDVGINIFKNYYVETKLDICLPSVDDKVKLHSYFEEVQTTMGRMFAHIILTEYRVYLMEKKLGEN